MNRTSRALRAAALFTGFGYAAQVLSLGAVPLYLQTIGANSYGLMVSTMAFMGYLNFADAGLSWGSIILIGQAHGRQDRDLIGKIVRNSIVLAAMSGAVIAVAVTALLWCGSRGYRLPMFAGNPETDVLIAIVGTQLIITLQGGVFYNLFQGLQEAYWTAFYQGVGRLASICAMMIVAWSVRTVAAIMLTQLVVTAMVAFASAVHAWRRHTWVFNGTSWIDPDQIRQQIRTGLKVFALQIGRTLVSSAPVMVLSSTIGPAAVPLYTVPTTILTLLFMPLNAWSTSLQSAYGEAWTSGNRAWVVKTFRSTIERGLFWGAGGAALFLPLASPFVTLWTNGRLVLPPWMPLAVATICFVGWFEMAGQYLLSGLNLQRKVAAAEIVCGLLVLVVSPWTVRWLGPAGIGLGFLIPALATSIRLVFSEVRAHVGAAAFPGWNLFWRVGLVWVVAAGLGSGFMISLDGGDWPRRLATMGGSALLTLVLFGGVSLLVRLDFIAEAVRHLAGGLRGRNP